MSFKRFSIITAPFICHITHIISVRTYEQVCRVNTAWIVASMTNTLRISYFVASNQPGYAVSQSRALVYSYSSITRLIDVARPVPAAVFLRRCFRK